MNVMSDYSNRREFLRASGALALAAGALGAQSADAPKNSAGASPPSAPSSEPAPPKAKRAAKVDPLVVGVMGTAGRGTELATEFATQPGSVVRYVCDVDENNAARCAKAVRHIAHLGFRRVEAVTAIS